MNWDKVLLWFFVALLILLIACLIMLQEKEKKVDVGSACWLLNSDEGTALCVLPDGTMGSWAGEDTVCVKPQDMVCNPLEVEG